MSGDTDNPRIWLHGDVLVAPVGATEPTDTSAAWHSAWETLGLLSEDGLTESVENDTTDHYAWGGILVRTTKNKHKRTFTVTALEDNVVVFGLVEPGSEAETSLGITTRTIKVHAKDERAFGFETTDGDITSRIVIPRGEVTGIGEKVRSESGMAMRELTITVYPDADGVLYYEITDDPQAITAS